MNDLQVSVIIPIYNGEAFLRDSIGSVRGQSQSNIGTIIVNDGSQDDSEALVRDLFPTTRVITQHNQGAATARNAGIEVARGEFVAFLDCDDVWDANKLDLHIK